MTAKTIEEVRQAFDNPATAQQFAANFVKGYFAQAMGILPKAEIDLLIFTQLIELNVIAADGSIFDIARALNLTPARSRSLLFQYQLRHIDEARGDEMVAVTLAKTNFSVDDKRLAFGIESPLVRAIIEAKLKTLGVFAEISLSGEVLKVSLDQLDLFITVLIGKERAKALELALKKEGYLKGKGLSAQLKKFGKKAGDGAAKEVGKQGFRQLFGGVSNYLTGDGVGMIGDLMDAVA